jgi:hypothetical protein
MTSDERFEQQEIDAAASEAAHIGGISGEEELDPAELAPREGGGGEAEGFEDAERALIEHASHADQQSAHAILHDQGDEEEYDQTYTAVEGDVEYSSELEDEDE